jgi:hypothetical protein
MPSVDELRELVRQRREELRDATKARQEAELEKSADVQKAALERELSSLETDIGYEQAAKLLIEKADEFNKPAPAVNTFESTDSPGVPSTPPPPPTVDNQSDNQSSDTDPLAQVNLPGDKSDDDEKEGK